MSTLLEEALLEQKERSSALWMISTVLIKVLIGVSIHLWGRSPLKKPMWPPFLEMIVIRLEFCWNNFKGMASWGIIGSSLVKMERKGIFIFSKYGASLESL
jgi:hypothetical protein